MSWLKSTRRTSLCLLAAGLVAGFSLAADGTPRTRIKRLLNKPIAGSKQLGKHAKKLRKNITFRSVAANAKEEQPKKKDDMMLEAMAAAHQYENDLSSEQKKKLMETIHGTPDDMLRKKLLEDVNKKTRSTGRPSK